MSRLIIVSAISKEVTGSPSTIRGNYIPEKYSKLIKDCEQAVSQVVTKFKSENE